MKRISRVSTVLPWVFILVFLALVLFPLASEGFFVSDDGNWMIIRLSAFYQALREGQFPVRFLGRLNNSYGYPVANFLYPGFLYIGSLIHLAGASFVDTVKIILAGSVGIGAICTYLWLRSYASRIASALGAVSFITLPYLGFDLYRRGSVGEILAMAMASMGLFGIAKSKRPLFAFSFTVLILSHNSLAVIYAAVLLLYLWQEKKLKRFLYPLVLAVGMSAFFWVPALAEAHLTRFGSVTVANSTAYMLSGARVYLVGSSLFFILLAVFARVKHRLVNFFIVLSLGSLLFATPVTQILWNQGLLPRLFQFPFRFLSVLTITVPFLVAVLYEGVKSRYRVLLVVLILVFGIVDLKRTIGEVEPSTYPEGYYVTNEGTTTVHDEYMPRWVGAPLAARTEQRLIFYDGAGTIEPPVYTRHAFGVTIDAREQSVMQINTVYYPGWGVAVDNKLADISYDNPAGLMRVVVPAGKHTLTVSFRETLPRFLIDIVSMISFILFALLVIQSAIKKHP